MIGFLRVWAFVLSSLIVGIEGSIFMVTIENDSSLFPQIRRKVQHQSRGILSPWQQPLSVSPMNFHRHWHVMCVEMLNSLGLYAFSTAALLNGAECRALVYVPMWNWIYIYLY